MLLSRLRKPVDTFFPGVARLYRSIRDSSLAAELRPTSYGFKLAGEPRFAATGFESREVSAFVDLLQYHDVVLDIGANVGFYSCLAGWQGKQVLACEPSPRNLKFLYRNIWENGLSNIEVFPLGLAQSPGIKRLYGFSDMASFVPGWAQADQKRSTLVPVTSLDNLIATRFPQKRLLIKMDVEGFEMDVLAGAQETLARTPKPTWLVEILLRSEVIPDGINPRFRDVFAAFWQHGYRCRALDSEHRLISPMEVNHWLTDGGADIASRNFLFFDS